MIAMNMCSNFGGFRLSPPFDLNGDISSRKTLSMP